MKHYETKELGNHFWKSIENHSVMTSLYFYESMNVLVPWIAKCAVHCAVDGISPDGLKCAGHVVGMLGMQAATPEHATSVGQGISWRRIGLGVESLRSPWYDIPL